MSSRTFVPNQERSLWNPVLTLCGATLWAALATLAGIGRAHFGIIELLFLFAPLVIIPLGLALIARLTGSGEHVDTACVFQIPAALAVVAAFWLPPGRTAAILSTLWLLQCVLLAGRRLLEWRHEEHTAVSPILNLAHFDLLLGAAWLVLSRAGLRPMGFQEPIILLTAVHFHYSGFATALIASTTMREFDSGNLRMPGLATLVWLIVLLPFVLAAGFVFSPTLRFVAAISLSACVTALALVSWWMAGNWQSKPARIYLRIAACAALGAFSFAGIYAVSEYFHTDWITIPGMANSHGLLNGPGFVLLMLLAWLMELGQRRTGDEVSVKQSGLTRTHSTRPSIVFARSAGNANTRDLRRVPAPDFVARDFYDR